MHWNIQNTGTATRLCRDQTKPLLRSTVELSLSAVKLQHTIYTKQFSSVHAAEPEEWECVWYGAAALLLERAGNLFESPALLCSAGNRFELEALLGFAALLLFVCLPSEPYWGPTCTRDRVAAQIPCFRKWSDKKVKWRRQFVMLQSERLEYLSIDPRM